MSIAPGESSQEEILGRRLREVRTFKGLPLKVVAGLTGRSIGLVSQIERGLSSPSIRMLQDICQVLDIPMSDLFEADFRPGKNEEGLIVRYAARQHLDFGAKRLIKELLTPSNSQNLQLMDVIMEAGGGSGDEFYAHDGEEAGVVVHGELELWVDEVAYRLAEGDSFYFESRRPHRFKNRHSGQTRILWVATPPLY